MRTIDLRSAKLAKATYNVAASVCSRSYAGEFRLRRPCNKSTHTRRVRKIAGFCNNQPTLSPFEDATKKHFGWTLNGNVSRQYFWIVTLYFTQQVSYLPTEHQLRKSNL